MLVSLSVILLADLPCHPTCLDASSRLLGEHGSVAQLVEQGIENPCVGGSIPSRATIPPRAGCVYATVGAPQPD